MTDDEDGSDSKPRLRVHRVGPLADEHDARAPGAQVREMQCQRIETGPGRLRALGIGAALLGDDVASLEGGSRFVVAAAALEFVDGLMECGPVARQPNLQEGVERPNDRHEIARTEVLVDEAMQRRADPLGVRATHEILVEVHADDARVLASGFGALVGSRRDGHRRAGGLSRCPTHLDEAHVIDRLLEPVFAQREIGGGKVVDGPPARVCRDDVDANGVAGRGSGPAAF